MGQGPVDMCPKSKRTLSTPTEAPLQGRFLPRRALQLRSLPGRKELNPIVPESLSHYDRLQAQVAVAVAYRGRPVGR